MGNPNRCVPTGLVSICLLLVACDHQIPPWKAGNLVVLVPEATQGPEAEFERELAQLLAEQLHVTLETVPLSQDEILPALRKHQAHLAAASLRSESNPAALQFGPSYQSVREVVVCNDNKDSPTITGGTARSTEKFALAAMAN
jgi:membrane-bound lytic murein transglycosylase MltF